MSLLTYEPDGYVSSVDYYIYCFILNEIEGIYLYPIKYSLLIATLTSSNAPHII